MSNQTETTTIEDAAVALKAEYNDYVLEATAEGEEVVTFKQYAAKKNNSLGAQLVKQVQATATPVIVNSAPSKSSIARPLFIAGKQAGLARKDIIAQFISVAGLTKAGAATYYANYSADVKAGKIFILPATPVAVEPAYDAEAAALMSDDAIINGTAVEDEIGNDLSLDDIAA